MTVRLYSDNLKDGALLAPAQVFNSFGHSATAVRQWPPPRAI